MTIGLSSKRKQRRGGKGNKSGRGPVKEVRRAKEKEGKEGLTYFKRNRSPTTTGEKRPKQGSA